MTDGGSVRTKSRISNPASSSKRGTRSSRVSGKDRDRFVAIDMVGGGIVGPGLGIVNGFAITPLSARSLLVTIAASPDLQGDRGRRIRIRGPVDSGSHGRLHLARSVKYRRGLRGCPHPERVFADPVLRPEPVHLRLAGVPGRGKRGRGHPLGDSNQPDQDRDLRHRGADGRADPGHRLATDFLGSGGDRNRDGTPGDRRSHSRPLSIDFPACHIHAMPIRRCAESLAITAWEGIVANGGSMRAKSQKSGEPYQGSKPR